MKPKWSSTAGSLERVGVGELREVDGSRDLLELLAVLREAEAELRSEAERSMIELYCLEKLRMMRIFSVESSSMSSWILLIKNLVFFCVWFSSALSTRACTPVSSSDVAERRSTMSLPQPALSNVALSVTLPAWMSPGPACEACSRYSRLVSYETSDGPSKNHEMPDQSLESRELRARGGDGAGGALGGQHLLAGKNSSFGRVRKDSLTHGYAIQHVREV